nr:MAG TPA: hypothetical protein [Caudoviricetes sp.]
MNFYLETLHINCISQDRASVVLYLPCLIIFPISL